jgi:hypothetical protein
MSGNIHSKPWTTSTAPGKKENPHHSNVYHRVWIQDAGLQGTPLGLHTPNSKLDVFAVGTDCPRRWNQRRKREYYDKYYGDLNAQKPHDEVFAVKANMKYWTHLQDEGTHSGGQDKLDPVPDKRSGSYSLGHLYKGKFADVRHSQLMMKTGRVNGKREPDEWIVDTRTMFDNRLKDDMVRFDDEKDRYLAKSCYELYRPTNTRSCPQMGADYMHR